MESLYFDNAASTRVDPRVLEAMLPYFCEHYANPSALHTMAQVTRSAVEQAREQLAELLGVDDPSEIIFTASATEANNTVIRSFSGRILVSAIEHASVLYPALSHSRTELIPVDPQGKVDEDAYLKLLSGGAELVSIIAVNNEIGTIQDIYRLGQMAKDAGAYFHSDLTQAVGKIPIRLEDSPLDYASLSAHKIHGPKGVGALWVRTGAPLSPLLVGGKHEQKRRASTLNVPGIVGLGRAAELLREEGEADVARMRDFRNRIISEVLARVPDSRLNGSMDGAPHIISLSFYRTEGETILINLDAQGICCTAGAACSSGERKYSHVLEAIGLPEEWLRGTIRVSLGRFNTSEGVDRLIEAIVDSVAKVRELAEFPSL
ncbi:MAG: cysteine desulfurase [Fimbriimonadales bacterium]|nr:cysteine desulfurase [Fimbriimonadales bacterium]